MNMPVRLWFDLTASFHWRRAPSGITRVEQECCRWMLDEHPDRVSFCVYDTDMQCWYPLPAAQARAVLDRRYDAAGAALPETVSAWQPGSAPLVFAPGDCFVCLNADQTPERLMALYVARKSVGLRVFGIVYDLIQILFPHFYWQHADHGCARFLLDMAWIAEHMVCISERTRDDLTRFYADLNVPPPELSLVRLGDELPAAAHAEHSAEVQDILTQPFILVVGTIEIRKNHETLYRAILDLLDRGEENLPLLVFAGMRGWRVDDLLTSLAIDPRVRGRVRILAHASDADLAQLYRACRFTAYPSLYEGWGLPVAESLAYGKFCLASNAGSIPEIAGELIEMLSPYDVRSWADRLLAYSRDDALLAHREAGIRRDYRVTPWRQTAAKILAPALRAARIGDC